MNIGDAAKESGLSADTIRFYERRGIVAGPGRAANGYREYTARHVEALRFAKGLRDLGMPLDSVAGMVRIVHDGTCGDVHGAMVAAAENALRTLDERLQAMRATRRNLVALRAGLAKMGAESFVVPGMMPCECVDMVARTSRRQHRVRS